MLVAACRSAEPGAEPPGRPTSTTAAAAAPPGLRVQEYPVPAEAGPTTSLRPPTAARSGTPPRGSGQLGLLRPGHRGEPADPLGDGSAPHGVIVGPDGAPWVTDGGLNAIVRVDPRTEKVDRYRCRPGRGSANLNTAAFRGGVLWFTGQAGVLGRLDPKVGRVEVFDAPRGRVPTASPPPRRAGVLRLPGRQPHRPHRPPDGRRRGWCRPPATRAPVGSGRTRAAGSG